MRVERDRRATLPEPAPHDQIGRRDHAVGLDERFRNLVPLDREAEAFEELGDRLGGAGAIARRIVGRDLDDLGEEARLGLRVASADESHGWRLRSDCHRRCVSPSMQLSKSLDAHAVVSRVDMRRQALRAGFRSRGRCAGW